MVCGSHAKTRAIYLTPPCPSLAASTAAYRRRSFSDSHPKNRCIFCSTSAAYPSMPHSLIQNLLRGKDTTASAIREVILDHILTIEAQLTRFVARLVQAGLAEQEGDVIYLTLLGRACGASSLSFEFTTVHIFNSF